MFSIKPKKIYNNEYINISNDNNENNSVLSIDLKTINFENISVELALNVLQLKHNEYYNMNQTQIIQYYNTKIKLTNNLNNILALKIILKSKLKGLDIKINKMNGIMVSDSVLQNNSSTDTKKINELSKTEQKINSMINNSQEEYKINQIQQNNFKIVQKNITSNINKNIVELPISSQKINNLNLHLNQNIKQSIQQNQNNIFTNNLISSEKINDITVINSSEFDIDTIINSYSQKKNNGFIK